MSTESDAFHTGRIGRSRPAADDWLQLQRIRFAKRNRDALACCQLTPALD
jgi:hypothetical protein